MKSKPTCRAVKSITGGFSLTELLVVIVVVIVLAAVSFTATAELKQRAAATKCMKQLKEWNVAIHGYAGDHGGQVLLYRWGMVGSGDTKAYNPYLSTFEDKSPLPNGEPGIALNYYRTCPAQWSKENKPGRGYFMTLPNVMQSSGKYGKFAMLDSNADGTPDSYPLSIVQNPADFLMMMDAEGYESLYRPSDLTRDVRPICINSESKAIRHNGSAHGMFADGHVESFTWSDIDPGKQENVSKTNRWFNMP